MSIQNISDNSQQKQKYSQLSFEHIFQQKVNKLQSKLNKYCSLYDSLMPLLPVSNIFPQLSSFEKQLESQYKKVQKCTQTLQENDKRSSLIDKNYWERQIKQINIIIEANQQEIKNILSQTKILTITQQFNNEIQNKLAQHKNNIQLQKISQRSYESKQMIFEYISQSISDHFIPINMELNQIQEQTSLLNLLLPKRDIRKFHQFNYHRIMYQITKIDKSLQQILSQPSLLHKQSSHSFQSNISSQYPQSQYQSKQLLSQIHKIFRQIEQIKWQIEGTDQKYKKQLALMFYQNPNKYQCVQIDQLIKKDMQEIIEKFKEVNFKYNKANNIVKDKINLAH